MATTGTVAMPAQVKPVYPRPKPTAKKPKKPKKKE